MEELKLKMEIAERKMAEDDGRAGVRENESD